MSSPTVVLKRGDTRTAIKATLLNSDGSVTDLTNATVKFVMADLQGNIKVNREAQIQDAQNGIVWMVFEPPETDIAGTYRAEFKVTFGDGRIETFPNDGYITIEIKPDLR